MRSSTSSTTRRRHLGDSRSSSTCPADLTDEQVSRLERVAETCPLRRSLEAGFTFEERTVASPAAAAA